MVIGQISETRLSNVDDNRKHFADLLRKSVVSLVNKSLSFSAIGLIIQLLDIFNFSSVRRGIKKHTHTHTHTLSGYSVLHTSMGLVVNFSPPSFCNQAYGCVLPFRFRRQLLYPRRNLLSNVVPVLRLPFSTFIQRAVLLLVHTFGLSRFSGHTPRDLLLLGKLSIMRYRSCHLCRSPVVRGLPLLVVYRDTQPLDNRVRRAHPDHNSYICWGGVLCTPPRCLSVTRRCRFLGE